MPKKIRWGVLSTANIGLKKVLPAMQQGQFTIVSAIASRDLEKARNAAAILDIDTAYGSYEELLADPNIDAIYNPLPNHMHVPWTIKAAEAGKHVLCEKPLSLTVAEAETLLAVRARTGVKIGEAFMVRQPSAVDPPARTARRRPHRRTPFRDRLLQLLQRQSRQHPQQGRHRRRRTDGHRLLHDPRLALRLPRRSRPASSASSTATLKMKTDRLTSAILDFPGGQSIFTCSTQLVPYQRIHFVGTKGRIELEIPVNAPPDRPTRLFLDSGIDLFGSGIATETFPVCDQYTLQGDAFSKAILDNTEVPVPLRRRHPQHGRHRSHLPFRHLRTVGSAAAPMMQSQVRI